MTPKLLVQGDEGRKYVAYWDNAKPRPFATIGIGHKDSSLIVGVTTWDDTKIDNQFEIDYQGKLNGIAQSLPWFKTLDAVRQAYVVNMAFQMGVTGVLGFHTTMHCLEIGDHGGAAHGVRASLWASQTPERAERCAKAFETGVWQS